MPRNSLSPLFRFTIVVFALTAVSCEALCEDSDDDYPSGMLYDMQAPSRPAKKTKRGSPPQAREKTVQKSRKSPRRVSDAALSFGLGYPYAALKYTPHLPFSAEARFATGDGVNIYSSRLYWNFETSRHFRLFAGGEGGYVKFDTIDTKGSGSIWSAFGGLEYFALKNISLSIDFAPTLINLGSDGVSVSGLEWVANMALYWRLF